MTENKKPEGSPNKQGSKQQRGGKRRLKKQPMSGWKKSLIVVAILAVIAIVVPLGGFGAAYVMVKVPEPEELVNKQVATILAADEDTELARIVPPEGNRRSVPIEEVPENLKSAVLAAEDREFYSNRGFSLTGFGRAVIGQITGNSSAGGGSTITQQYVKNALVGNNHSYKRKLKELVYSAKMANEWSKDEVLQAYLNTIYFGRSAYGVAAASQAYFGKPLQDLTFAESAVLAASIQRPSQLDPWTHREAAEARWNYVLDGMVDIGAITPQERAAAIYPEVTDPNAVPLTPPTDGSNGLIRNQVLAELGELGIDEAEVQTRGLRIITTIDMDAQNSALEAVKQNLAPLKEETRAAVVSVDPRNGAVRAYYGGDDPNGWDYANAGLQTGSSFKVFGLAAALTQGIPLTQMYSSAPVNTGNITVTNAEGESCGVCNIATALKMSLNTSFIRLEKDLDNGAQDVADMAHALGVARSLPGIPDTLSENGDTPYQGIILGQYQSRPLDMAVALGTLANQGVLHKTHFVQKVTASNGEVLYEHQDTAGSRRVGANVANSVMKAMLPIAQWSNNNVLAGGRPSAAKTGTAQLGDSGQNKDAWMIGATPQLSTAVWIGTVDNSPLVNSWGGLMYGSGQPASIWKQTMDGALAGQDIEYFPQANPLGFYKVTENGTAGGYYGGDGYGTGYGAGTDSTTDTEEGISPDGQLPAPEEAPVPAPVAPAPAPAGPEEIEILPGVTVPNPFA